MKRHNKSHCVSLLFLEGQDFDSSRRLDIVVAQRSEHSEETGKQNIMTLQVFQAVTLNISAYQPHALLMQILLAKGPSILRKYFRPRAHNKSHRQLGLVQIRIALQEVCNIIDR